MPENLLLIVVISFWQLCPRGQNQYHQRLDPLIGAHWLPLECADVIRFIVLIFIVLKVFLGYREVSRSLFLLHMM